MDRSTPTAVINWDANGLPVSSHFDDVYFSKNSGIDETRFVFLHHNHLPERWKNLSANAVFTIAETGFGTGLNFLAAWQAWRQHAPPTAKLHFISVEKFPLMRNDLERALHLWPELSEIAKLLIAQYPSVDARGFHRLNFGAVQLTLIFADAIAGFSQLLPIARPGPEVISRTCGFSQYARANCVDAWFLDGFAPAKNPDLWTEELFQLVARLSHEHTTFATFTSAGIVRRGLTATGFAVEKVAGYGSKREMLRGRFAPDRRMEHPPLPSKTKYDASWHLVESASQPAREVAVIGAGLAGCHTAWALAQKGLRVTLIEQFEPGAGASGNPLGILYSRLSHTPSALADFNLLAYLYACRFYHANGLFNSVGNACGVLQMPEQNEHETQLRLIAETFTRSADLVRWLDQDGASEYAGVPLNSGALLLSQTGWLHPQQLCRALATHSNIRLLSGSHVKQLSPTESGWQLSGSDGDSIATADTVVIACAFSAKEFAQSHYLPLKKIRGQISLAHTSGASAGLRTALCGEGYIAPAIDGQHCVGASFVLKTDETALSWDEHQQNLANAAVLSPAFKDLTIEDISHGRVSFRCTTPDYLPIVGPVAQADAMLERFAPLRRDAKAVIDSPGIDYSGLFINVGHGSRGLAYTPLSAELLASQIANHPLPLPRDLIQALHPARFLIRDLGRNRI
jgi:tRNA 5-methylaminomethyl-2-thiouridine biosynthesis bifunctional protein